MSEPSEPLLIPEKMAYHFEISNELLMDMGVIPDTRPPRKPPTRRERFRWWRSDMRERFAARLYRLASGHNLPDPDDY